MTMHHTSLSVFMTKAAPSGTKYIVKVPNHAESCQMAKMFFFHSSFLFFFRWASSKLHDSLTMVFT